LVELLDGVEHLSNKDKLKKLATEIIPGVLPMVMPFQ